MQEERKTSPEPWADSQTEESTLASALVRHLEALGVEQAFGVSGGAIAMIFDALAESSIRLFHFRHESGAAFAAAEAHFASNKPTVVFCTTGPGTLNALNGLAAARWDDAKVILLSGATSSKQRGRWATQESSSYTMPQDNLYTQGAIFDFAVRMEQVAEFPEVIRRLSMGMNRPDGFVAHVCLPMQLQSTRLDARRRPPRAIASMPGMAMPGIAECMDCLGDGNFAVWAGFGARFAAPQIRKLIQRTGAYIMTSPRGKGIVSENHPQFLGVTGLGGHDAVIEHMVHRKPDWVLVLGTRLGEATSFWDNDLLPAKGFLHVDLDPEVPGTAYPEAYTIAIQAEIGHFLDALLVAMEDDFPELPDFGFGSAEDEATVVRADVPQWQESARAEQEERPRALVRPQLVMRSLQHRVVQESDALIMAECGNSFAWCNHYLRFSEPNRYRVSPRYGSMGHFAAGVVGAALARGEKTVAVVGDGSMLMNSEISTAVQYRASAVWIVLNDAAYGMVHDGHEALGLSTSDTEIPGVDFVAFARAMGADGLRVELESELDEAFEKAMVAEGPFVIDVLIDGGEMSPLFKRFESLIKQGNAKGVAGWENE